MSEPTVVWVFMISNSSLVRRPGLLMTAPGMEILPMSWRVEAVLMSRMSAWVRG